MKNDSLAAADKEMLKGISRREFLKFCGIVAAGMGLPVSMGVRIADAVTDVRKRPPVIWLHGQECTGCTETLLRPNHPTLESLILDLISLDYHETLSAGAGLQAEDSLRKAIDAGSYVMVVEGSIPLKDGGIYCQVGGRPFVRIVEETAVNAAAVIAIGSCASWGGVQSSGPNPTGAAGVQEVLQNKQVVNIPGCPPNGYNFLSTVLNFITFGALPDLDHMGRPRFAYGQLIHSNCERRPHFDAGRFAEKFGDEGHRKGYCLYKLGCKGTQTHSNCPSLLFCDVGSGAWPVGTGHPCFGCTEKTVGFTVPLHTQADISHMTPFRGIPPIETPHGEGMSKGAAALLGGIAGAAIGAGAVVTKYLGDKDKQPDEEEGE